MSKAQCLEFREAPPIAGKRTPRWTVHVMMYGGEWEGAKLGSIVYRYGSMSGYHFLVSSPVNIAPKYLRQIADFAEQRTAERRQQRVARKESADGR